LSRASSFEPRLGVRIRLFILSMLLYSLGLIYDRILTAAKSDRNFKDALVVQYDALVVPGGVWSSTVVRNDEGQ
jgi:hypothetical protein